MMEIKSILEMAEEIFKDARGTTVAERKAINDFVRAKSKTISRKKLDDELLDEYLKRFEDAWKELARS